MPRSYRHIQEYEKEIIELRNKGCTGREIYKNFELTKKQYDFITRYNKKQAKLAEVCPPRKTRQKKGEKKGMNRSNTFILVKVVAFIPRFA